MNEKVYVHLDNVRTSRRILIDYFIVIGGVPCVFLIVSYVLGMLFNETYSNPVQEFICFVSSILTENYVSLGMIIKTNLNIF